MSTLPKHVAIIMDGNGRWATNKGLPRQTGHYFGFKKLQKIAAYADDLGIEIMTVYAFSTENWRRPLEEIEFLMKLPIDYLINSNIKKLKKNNIKIMFIGRKSEVPQKTLIAMNKIEDLTKDKTGLTLNICFDYGSYEEISNAFNKVNHKSIITAEDIESNLYIKRNVDLLIRTGGEQRLSNFLLWQLGYAELYFTKKYWPAFSNNDFDKALEDFSERQRRYGGL